MGGSCTREEAREGELMTRVEKAKGEAKKKKPMLEEWERRMSCRC